MNLSPGKYTNLPPHECNELRVQMTIFGFSHQVILTSWEPWQVTSISLNFDSSAMYVCMWNIVLIED